MFGDIFDNLIDTMLILESNKYLRAISHLWLPDMIHLGCMIKPWDFQGSMYVCITINPNKSSQWIYRILAQVSKKQRFLTIIKKHTKYEGV